MLDEKIKETIQKSYTRLLDAKDYKARYCQRMMIAEIATTLGSVNQDDDKKRLDGPHIAVIEAGTGTGKTVAYCLAAIPLAKALGKSLVISTATVTLQEQIVFTDLPDLKMHAELDFSFALAKGRRRYLCLNRLDQVLVETEPGSQRLPFYDDEFSQQSDVESIALFQLMLKKLSKAEWDGERDSWQEEIDDRDWFQVSTDHNQCLNRKCENFRNCYFYKAREQIHKVDCIVTNHDLVLSDLIMGGGAVLPEPENTIYIFDEGHHLPEKAISHFTNFTTLTGTRTWLEQLVRTLTSIEQQLSSIFELGRDISWIEESTAELSACLLQMEQVLREEVQETLVFNARNRGGYPEPYRFSLGQVEESIRLAATELHQRFSQLGAKLRAIVEEVDSLLLEQSGDEKDLLEQCYPILGTMASRAESNSQLWHDYAKQDHPDAPPRARWINIREGSEDLQVNSSPISVADLLKDCLWDRCYGAVVTSATLSVAGNFDRVVKNSGIDKENCFKALPSPFDFQRQAKLQIPKMNCDPRDQDAHSQMLIDELPALLKDSKGSLVLFTSWKQMFSVLEGSSEKFREQVLAQGELARTEIVRMHKKRVDSGKASTIFGLASFAEGIDLPGEYCNHVVISKIPFAVPNDPVGATLGEWIEHSGGNSFMEIAVPEAILKLVQASGRLLRTEHDEGTITIFDRRLVTQRYGEFILNALPAFRREIG